MDNDVKNCHFCGGTVKILSEIEELMIMFKWEKCFALLCFTGGKSRQQSVELFNNRQDEFYKFSVYFFVFNFSCFYCWVMEVVKWDGLIN